jgi:hypothetical protein
MTGFLAPWDRVQVESIDVKDWRVLRPLWSRTSDGKKWVVPEGAETDFASAPRIVAWAIPSYGKYTAPAITHDYFYRWSIPRGYLTYNEADRYLRELMLSCGVLWVTAWVMWTAVRWAGLGRSDRDGWVGAQTGWWRDAPLILAWTLPALVFFALPTLAILSSLALWWLSEALAWFVRRALGKKATPPTSATLST